MNHDNHDDHDDQLNQDIQAVIFDLGGVLVRLGGMESFRQEVAPLLTMDEFFRKWLFSPAVRAHESGKIDVETFLDELMREFEVACARSRVQERFAGFLTGLYPGAEGIFTRLKGKAVTGILSNTSWYHWNEVTERFPELLAADRLFLSCEMGLLKPDAVLFEALVDRLGMQPGQIVFFDDNPDNIAGAEKAGLRAFRVDGCGEAVRLLEDWGF